MAKKRRRSQKASSRDIVARWGQEDVIFTDGFLAVPLILLENLPSIGQYGGLSPTELVFLLQLMSFKWDASAPFPSYKRIAAQMGVSEVYVRKLARALEDKQLLIRHAREGTTNEFDLRPFFEALKELGARIDAEKKQAADLVPDWDV